MGDLTYDVIVVGAGVEGLSTARYLAKLEKKVLLLEQFAWPHGRGSSWGPTRITRLSYTSNPYAALMPDAYKAWAELEAEVGMTLFRKTGLLLLGKDDNPTLASYHRTMVENGFEHEKLDQRQMQARYSHLTIPDKHYGITDPSGGLLFASKALVALMESFKKHGGTFLDSHPMRDVVIERHDGNNKRVKIHTSNGSFICKRVILTMGPWAPDFLRQRFNLNLPIEPQKTLTCYWRDKTNGKYSHSNGFPLIMGTAPTGPIRPYYIKPSLEYPGLVQMGVHIAWKADPDNRDDTEMTESYLELCRNFANAFLPGIDVSKPALIDKCMYTENLYDRGYILDHIPGHPDIIVGTGFTGHGFKLAPIIGKMLGDMAVDAKPSYPLEAYRICRFPKGRL